MEDTEKIPVYIKIINGKTVCICHVKDKGCKQNCQRDIVSRDKFEAGRITLDDVYLALKSWLGNAKKFADSYRTRKHILGLYHRLYHSYRMEGVIA